MSLSSSVSDFTYAEDGYTTLTAKVAEISYTGPSPLWVEPYFECSATSVGLVSVYGADAEESVTLWTRFADVIKGIWLGIALGG